MHSQAFLFTSIFRFFLGPLFIDFGDVGVQNSAIRIISMVQWIQCFLPKLLLNHGNSLSSLHFSRVSLASDNFVSFGARPIEGEEEGERCIFETSLLRICAIVGANLRNQGPNHFEVFLIAVGEIVLFLSILMWAAQKFSLRVWTCVCLQLLPWSGPFSVLKLLACFVRGPWKFSLRVWAYMC